MPEDEVDPSSATIVVSSLRMRSGPGVEYEVIGAAQAGDTFSVVGQANGCQWLNVEHPTLGNVWLSGAPQYTKITGTCDQIPAVEPPPLDTSVPTPDVTPAPVEEPGQQSAPAPTTAPTVEAAAPRLQQRPNPQHCRQIRLLPVPELRGAGVERRCHGHGLRLESTISVSRRRQEPPYCFAPGRYAITIDGPTALERSEHRRLDVHAGEPLPFPGRMAQLARRK